MSWPEPSDHRTNPEQNSFIPHDPPVKGKPARRWRLAVASTWLTTILLMGLGHGSISYAATTRLPPSSTSGVHTTAATTENRLTYTAVEGAHYYTIALRSDGSVWAWGRNMFGELGVSEDIRYRHTSSPIRIPGITNVIAISAAGSGINAAVQADGTVWEWGAGTLPYQVEGISSAKDVVTSSFNIALLRNGTVMSWQHPGTQGNHSEVHRPHVISGLKDIIQVGSSGQQGYALKKDGSLWTWNEPSQPDNPPSKPAKLKGLSNISSITSTDTSLLVLDQNGKVWALGEKGKPVLLHDDLKVKQMDGNSQYILLLTTSGEVYSYGRTVTGKEGRVKHLSGITDISAGYHHSLALSSDGTVWGWGSDKYQEAGAPATSSGGMVYQPVQAKLGIDVYINDELFQSTYSAVQTQYTVQLPVRAVSEAIGVAFERNQVNGIVEAYSLQYEDRTVTIRPNELEATVKSTSSSTAQSISLPEPIVNYSGATTVPFEVFEALGLTVNWNEETRMLTIQSDT
ncbi:stalk domain-containing protein [Paenibacillus illinoisensis]|uniref:Regulator of chromosome condensation rcc1 n=1 Tax=Paenibacillus illinoisensis TaxID=59845 RepID=A0A2W0CE50_9BACL|nr:stalk domain-containing protein [Paenibacillus illinoisensis]PYY31253.1 Regulator of chromosome condensation rcc1 [Paenibacillus illinoisensis]